MLRNKSIFQIIALICLSSISICNYLIDLLSYFHILELQIWGFIYDTAALGWLQSKEVSLVLLKNK
jgi:hypothetical protein